MHTIGPIVKEIRKSKNMTQADLSKLTGFKQNTISNHENGKRQLDESDIRIYAAALNLEPEQLFQLSKSDNFQPKANIDQLTKAITATASELTSPRKKIVLGIATVQLEAQLAEQAAKIKEELVEYHVYERLSAGQGTAYYEDYHFDTVYYDEDISHDLASWIYGDSMEPAYLNGEVALIKDTGFDYDGAVYAVDWAGQTYIKKVYKEQDGLRLVSLNPKYAPLFAHMDESPRIIGKVIGHFMPIEM